VSFVPGSVKLAWVHSEEVAHSWHLSVMDLIGWDLAEHQRILSGGYLAVRYGSGGLVAARNKAVATFLDSTAEWLMWVDTDMGFAPDAVDQLVAAADPAERPIVGGLCFAQSELLPDGMGGYVTRPTPTLYQWAENATGCSGFTPWLDYPREQLVRVAATGSAMILIHRSVLEALRDEVGPTWYSRLPSQDGQLLSEDLPFCARAGAAGIPIHVHTGVKTTHLKPVWLSETHHDETLMLDTLTRNLAQAAADA